MRVGRGRQRLFGHVRRAEEERALLKQLTGREREPGQRVEEFVGVIGRRPRH